MTEGYSPLRFSQYAKDLSKAVQSLGSPVQFDTSKISRADLTRALDRADVEKGSAERQTSWDGQIMNVDWVSPEDTKVTPMSVSGLAPGLLQAKLAELRKRGQERLAAGVAKIDAAHTTGLSKIDAAADEAAKKIDAEIDSALHEFAESTNGGPA